MPIKVCIIGGGSRAWAIKFMRDLVAEGTVCVQLFLYDIDKEAAKNNEFVASRMFLINHAENRLSAIAVDTLEEGLDGAVLVIISIEPGKTEIRYSDLVIPEKYGILQSVGDTTGPGGIFRARRAIPLFLNFGKAIKEHCPNAWVINYTNPMTLCTAALFQVFPHIKALGCCHEVFGTEKFVASLISVWKGIPLPERRDIHLDITGINHFTFATKAMYDGHDFMPELTEFAAHPETYKDRTIVALERIKQHDWFTSDHLIALSFLRDFGALGAAGDRHLSEFVPWFLNDEREYWKLGVVRTPYSWRATQANDKHDKIFSDEELIVTQSSDEEGIAIMSALLGKKNLLTNINRPNEGQVKYLPLRHVVESNGYISCNAIRPVIATDPPLAIQILEQRVAAIQSMTLEAVSSNDDDLLFIAFLEDPLMTIPVAKARELFKEMLAFQEKFI